MKTLIVENKELKLIDLTKPELKDKGAILKVSGCGLCGSDIVKYLHSEPNKDIKLGHEIVAEIVEIKSETNFAVGDKIVVSHHIPCLNCEFCKNGHFSMCEHFKKTNFYPCGFSEYVYITEEHLQNTAFKIPKNLTEVEASFYEPLACCIRAVKKACDGNTLVIGLGSIGLLMGQVLNAYGARAFGCDILQNRIDLANKLGISSVNSSMIEEKKYDSIFMTSGADATIDIALKAVKDGGTIVVFSSTPKNFGYANNEIYYRELTILGSYSPSLDDLKESIKLLSDKKVMVEGISTIYPFDRVKDAFEDTMSNKILKAYVKM